MQGEGSRAWPVVALIAGHARDKRGTEQKGLFSSPETHPAPNRPPGGAAFLIVAVAPAGDRSHAPAWERSRDAPALPG